MAMTPGPNTFAICCVASTGSRRDGLSAAAGVVAATGLWAGIAMLGAGAVVAWNHQLFLGLRAVAALYLIGIGLRMLVLPLSPRPALAGGQPFLVGLLTALANPFAIAFWLGTFLAAMPATAPDHLYARIFGLIILQSLIWYSALAILFSTAMRGRTPGTARLLRYVTAGAMILIGLSALVPG
ncbi:LysE family translocator [Paracoccus lichenicola]|nr:LysE family transporter [Paracoccus lichenicola]